MSEIVADEVPRSGSGGVSYRLVLGAAMLGVVGACAALAFDELVRLAQELLLEGIAGYAPPAVGVLHPEHAVPGFPDRLWLPVVTVLGALVSGFLVYRFAPAAEGHGTDAAIEAYHHAPGTPPLRLPVVKALSAALTIGSGGVAGREGPTAQISGSVGSWLIEKLGLRRSDRRVLMLASIAAGPAAAFQAPLGMAIFAVEILYAGMVFESEALIFTVIAAVVSYAVHGLFVGWQPIFAVPPGLRFDGVVELPGYVLLGISAGLLAAVLPWIFYRIRDGFAALPVPRMFRPAIGALGVGLMALVAPEVLGTGYGWVELALAGELAVATMALLLVLKIPAMALTVASGGSGGIFAPTVTIGALLGGLIGTGTALLAPGAGVSVPSFIVVGMAAVFGAAARTPLSTLIMVAEMTNGYGLIVPTMLSVMLAFVVQRALTGRARYPTLYESQVESREDSPAHQGVLVRRAFELVDVGKVQPGGIPLPRLVSMLRLGEPISLGVGGARMLKLRIEEGSWLVGRTIADAFAEISGVTAVAVLRRDRVLIPRGPTDLAAGDELVVMAGPGSVERLAGKAADPGPADATLTDNPEGGPLP